MNVEIDQDECMGCEACVEICPDVFAFDEDETRAYVKEDASGSAECIEEAIGSCPASCITND